MIQVGQKVRFDPLAAIRSQKETSEYITGTVVFVNNKNKWFSVQYGENKLDSFKFYEIGQNVHICKQVPEREGRNQ